MALVKGKYLKLFIQSSETDPESDEDYVMVGTENEITISIKAEDENYVTKSYGRIVDPGEREMTIKGTCEVAVDDDAGLLALKKADGKTVSFQVRDVSGSFAETPTPDKVYIEGTFAATECEEKAGAKGLVEYTFTLLSSGRPIRNFPSRELTTAGA